MIERNLLMKITSNKIVLTEKEIINADKEFERLYISKPEHWQSYLSAPEEVKNIMRVIVFWPKERQNAFLEAMELELSNDI